MSWFLYLLECRDGTLYTGIAVDVEKRFAAHVSGRGARYTRSHPPQRILLTLPYPDRSSASKAEYALKQLSAAQKRAYVKVHGAKAPRVKGQEAKADEGKLRAAKGPLVKVPAAKATRVQAQDVKTPRVRAAKKTAGAKRRAA